MSSLEESWVDAGQDFSKFWHTPIREISIVLNGAARRLSREQNDRAWAIWHTAYLTAYAPTKSKDFPRLKSLLITSKRPAEPKVRDWRETYAKYAAWAGSFRKD